MATLVFTAIGTAVGGPLGGAIGSLIGNTIDRSLAGGSKREGPRLKELGVSTSSYGTPIPRHHGTVRSAGTIIWATNLVEHSTTSGGGKGSASTTTYNYTVSLAVALSSRPIQGVGRIWADGNLLRGAAGDLKAGGSLRLYTGEGDAEPDPLIASAQSGAPAFRGLAYCVFENLDLTDFGNRIPALTFEIVADGAQVGLDGLLEPLTGPVSLSRPLTGLQGFSNEGGALLDTLAVVDQLYPIACDAGGEDLSLRAGDAMPHAIPLLPSPAAATDDGESFAVQSGQLHRRKADAEAVPAGVRYYDRTRDFQPGMQRADGRAQPGRNRTIEFPGVLSASDARALANGAAARAAWSRDRLAWRMAELDPALGPGQVVRVPGRDGLWSIDSWEWRDQGIELELRRVPRGPAAQPAADAGQSLPAADHAATPTVLLAYELPWDGNGTGDVRRAYAAASSDSQGWTGAALYLVEGGNMLPISASGRQRSVVGSTVTGLSPSPATLLERGAWFEIDLASEDFALDDAQPEDIAQGANMALVGAEILQFARAERSAGRRWRVSGLLRGRGGSEAAALAGTPSGSAFVLLDERPILLDQAKIGSEGAATIAALGLADSEPVTAELANPGLTRRPLSPVHGSAEVAPDGTVSLSWCRRARGAWTWLDGVDAPLSEPSEAYVVGVGDPASPALAWNVGQTRLELTAATWSDIVFAHPTSPVWVRQVGAVSQSDPLLLTTTS